MGVGVPPSVRDPTSIHLDLSFIILHPIDIAKYRFRWNLDLLDLIRMSHQETSQTGFLELVEDLILESK